MRSSTLLRRVEGRMLAALVLALFTLGWIADRAHQTFEAHAWCEEHQRVEHHASNVAADGHASVDAAADRGPSIDALSTESAEHAACCVLLSRGDDPVAVPNARVEVSWIQPGVVLGRAPPSPRASVAPIPLVLLAPKQSPPAI